MNNEPVAWINVEKRKLEWDKPTLWETPTVVKLDRIPLYTHPVKEQLTDEEITELANEYLCYISHEYEVTGIYKFARAILRKAQSTCNGFCGEYECKENQAICKRKAEK